MWGNNQKTLNKSVRFSGTGLHSGAKVSMYLEPTEADVGIVFKRTDLNKNNNIKANFKNVSSARLCTKIENEFGEFGEYEPVKTTQIESQILF